MEISMAAPKPQKEPPRNTSLEQFLSSFASALPRAKTETLLRYFNRLDGMLEHPEQLSREMLDKHYLLLNNLSAEVSKNITLRARAGDPEACAALIHQTLRIHVDAIRAKNAELPKPDFEWFRRIEGLELESLTDEKLRSLQSTLAYQLQIHSQTYGDPRKIKNWIKQSWVQQVQLKLKNLRNAVNEKIMLRGLGPRNPVETVQVPSETMPQDSASEERCAAEKPESAQDPGVPRTCDELRKRASLRRDEAAGI
jgi:hypothetical protein